MGYKVEIAMVCISALSAIYMLTGGDGAALGSAVAALGTLAGFEIGKHATRPDTTD